MRTCLDKTNTLYCKPITRNHHAFKMNLPLPKMHIYESTIIEKFFKNIFIKNPQKQNTKINPLYPGLRNATILFIFVVEG